MIMRVAAVIAALALAVITTHVYSQARQGPATQATKPAQPPNPAVKQAIADFDAAANEANRKFDAEVSAAIQRAEATRNKVISAAATRTLARLTTLGGANPPQEVLEQAQHVRTVAAAARPAPSPASVFQLSNGRKKYLLVLAPVSWDEASRACQQMGGKLAMPKTQAEAAFLQKTVGENRLYIGGAREKGQWKWLDGEAVAPKVWGPDRPTDHADADRIGLGGGGIGNYTGKPNKYTVGFICEWN